MMSEIRVTPSVPPLVIDTSHAASPSSDVCPPISARSRGSIHEAITSARRQSSAPTVAGTVHSSAHNNQQKVVAASVNTKIKKDTTENASDSSSSSDDDYSSSSPADTTSSAFLSPSDQSETVRSGISMWLHIAGKTFEKVFRAFAGGVGNLFQPPKHRKECLEHSSCFVFDVDTTFRNFIYNFAHHKAFEGFVILVIFMNCFVLALDDPTTDVEPEYQKTLNVFFTATFTLEMCLKMVAFGVVLHEGSYFRSGWNALDFLIVVLSYLQFIPGFSNFTAFRTLRVLRPLRSMNALPQLKTIATCLVHSVKGLANVFILSMFIYCVFSILAVQLWMGNMRFRCAYYDGTIEEALLCTTTSGGSVVGASCPVGMDCVPFDNPNHGYTSFDNLLWALLVVFQTITLEGWAELMYNAMDSCGWPAAIFFVLVVILGSYFVLNLCLAVISFHFQNVKEKMLQREIEAAKREEMEIRKSEEGIQRARASLRLGSGTNPLQALGNLEASIAMDAHTHRTNHSDTHRVIDTRKADELEVVDRLHLAKQITQSAAGCILRIVLCDEIFGPADASPLTSNSAIAKLRPLLGSTWRQAIVLLYRLRWFVFELVEGDIHEAHIEALRKQEAQKLRLLGRVDEAERLKGDDDPEASTTVFAKIIFLCILFNTLVLAASHFNESEMQTEVSAILNTVFTCVFFLEMVLKNFSLNPLWYWSDAFNVFDGCVTILSAVEVFFLEGSSRFSVFRAFRMLRVIRLMRGVQSLRQLIEVFGLALRECGYLFVIFGLYFLMASLVGMQFFGDSLQERGLPDAPTRTSFASFPKAFYAMMQINTYDSWPDNMWNSMYATSNVALIFYIVCIFIGNLCVLNLLVAILIDSFEQYAKKHTKHHHSIESESESDDDGDAVVKRGIAVTILSAEPVANGTTLLPKGANEFLTKEMEVKGVDTKKASAAGVDGFKLGLSDILQNKQTASPIMNNGNAAIENNGESASEELNSIDHSGSANGDEDLRICELCGEPIVTPFQPISKSIVPLSAQELHDRICEKIQFRKIKERVIKTLIGGMVSLESDSDSEEGDEENPSSFRKFLTAPAPQPNIIDLGLDYDPTKHKALALHDCQHEDFYESPFHTIVPNSKSDVINKKLQTGRFPTPAAIEDVFGRAWEVGVLLGENVEDYIHLRSWGPVKRLLRREFALLQMKIGEEQIGRALVAYTRANVPHQILTNGGDALFLFGPRNPIRVHVYNLVTWKVFDFVVLGAILVSSILMALDNPSNDPDFSAQLTTAGRVLTAVFCVEMAFKCIAFGFFFWPQAYLRDAWNWLDFLVVIVSVLSWVLEVVYSSSGISSLKVLRTLRIIRPLRLINHNKGLRMVVLTLLQSVKGIANITLILVLVFLIFAILGVQLFGGILWSCSDESVELRVNCTGSFVMNVTAPELVEINRTILNGTAWELVNVTALVTHSVIHQRVWKNANFHFDDTINAFVSLFHIATLDDWGNMMYDVIAGVDFDHGPQEWHNTAYGLYFVAFVFVGSMFLMNMFIGLIIENFQTTKAHMDGVGLLTEDQKLWVETQRMMLNFRPQRLRQAGKLKIQRALAHIAEETWFELTTAVVVMLNIIVIATEHVDQPESLTKALTQLNVVFTALFIAEATVKIIAYDVNYFMEGWNRFDFFIVVLGLFDLSTNGDVLPINVGLIRILRVFRIARILALVRKARDIRVLLETLWYSIPSLANIGAFMFLIIFVFTVLGVQIWGKVKQDGEGLTSHMNFENFGTAFLFLIQVTTLDNWGATMTSLQIVENCDEASSSDGVDHCGSVLSPLYFIPFILISSYVMVNLFCAIILDNFDTTMELDKSDLKVSDLKKFADAWALFDPQATMLTRTRNFPNLLAALKPPLGIERKTDRHMLLKIAREYVIPEHEGQIHFVETLIPLARKVLGVEFSDEEIREHEELWKIQFPDLNNLRVIRYRQKRVTVDQYFAATYIAGAFRRRLARKVVTLMRRDKRDDILSWYEDNDVPECEMHAIHRMDREERERALNMIENRKAIAEMVLRGRRDSVGSEEDDEVLQPQLDHTVTGLIGCLQQEEKPEDKPPQHSHSPQTGGGGVRRASIRRESVAGRRDLRRKQSLGLTGFTHLWAKHAAEL